MRITAEDGTVQDYELLQYGELADAEVVPALESVEISFQGDPVDLAYTTNMGDKYAYSIAYEEGGSEGWLTAEHRGEGLLTLTAEPWDDMERDRPGDADDHRGRRPDEQSIGEYPRRTA